MQTLLCFSIRRRHRPRLRVIGDYVPRVDVLVTCAGEDIDVILDTVKAASDVDWPRKSFRVIVLDDKNSEEVRREVQLLALKNTSIHYTARDKVPGVPSHFSRSSRNLFHIFCNTIRVATSKRCFKQSTYSRLEMLSADSVTEAGNLNHGLEYIQNIGGQKAEYVAALDADMIVERHWLRAILPHLLIDPEMAIATPPQVCPVIQSHIPLP